MGFSHGANRHEALRFPERLDDAMPAEHPGRFLDAFVAPSTSPRSACSAPHPQPRGGLPIPPAALLQLSLDGSLYRLRSSRRLAQATHRPVACMGLLKQLRPDHKTLADCRKHHWKPLHVGSDPAM
jgi:transposase